MASGDLIVKVADKDTLDRTYANTNAILAAVGEDVRIKGVKRYGMKINKNDSNPATHDFFVTVSTIVLRPFTMP